MWPYDSVESDWLAHPPGLSPTQAKAAKLRRMAAAMPEWTRMTADVLAHRARVSPATAPAHNGSSL